MLNLSINEQKQIVGGKYGFWVYRLDDYGNRYDYNWVGGFDTYQEAYDEVVNINSNPGDFNAGLPEWY